MSKIVLETDTSRATPTPVPGKRMTAPSILARKKDGVTAEPLLLVSLVAAVFTFLPYAVVPGVRDNVSTNDIAFALVILAITWTVFWFARHSRQRGWLT